MKKIVLGIDPGSENSGIVTFQLFDEWELLSGSNVSNEGLFELIDKYTLFDDKVNLFIVYEDIRPFTSRFNMDTINTCKMIGRLECVLNQRRVPFKAITRNEVKNFVFKRYPDIVLPVVIGKIEKKGGVSKKGKPLKPSFQYVDDRIVHAAMRYEYKIEKQKRGKTNMYGISTHAWQALGVTTAYILSNEQIL